MKITERTKISELLQTDERAAQVLASVGLSCVGCLTGGEETLAEAAAEHRAQRRARNKVKKREPLFPAVPIFSWVFRAERV